MSKVLLVWSTYAEPKEPDLSWSVQDHWSVHDSLSEAREEYQLLLKLPNLHSASVCGVIQSTDYSACLLYTSPSPRDGLLSRMPSSA